MGVLEAFTNLSQQSDLNGLADGNVFPTEATAVVETHFESRGRKGVGRRESPTATSARGHG